MYFYRKLKPNWDITGLLPALILYIVFFIVWILAGIQIAIRIMGYGLALYAIFSVYIFLRTRSYGYCVSMLYICSLALFVITMPVDYLFEFGALPVLSKLLGFITVILLVWAFTLLISGKTKWRGRDLFELAAMNINEVDNGYTSRPHPVGAVEGSIKEILSFAEFLERNLIRLTRVEDDRVVLIPVMMGQEYVYLFGRKKFDINTAWISIDFNGHVAVNIVWEDYLKFRENLSFNQICINMGTLFIDFFEMYKKGDGIRILDRLNSLRMGIFS